MKKINVEELRELFIEIKYGNNIAFEKLYKNYKNLVYKIAYSILKNSYDSDDIVQILYLKRYILFIKISYPLAMNLVGYILLLKMKQ